MYLQPEFYHFSEDSIGLAKYCATKFEGQNRLKVLDLGSGCGVVGIEFCLEYQNIESVTFLEPQQEFKKYLEGNSKKLIGHIPFEIIMGSIEYWNFPQKYDLVISNPPYFLHGEGRPSLDQRKNSCHFMTEELFKCFIVVAKNSLAPNGKLYFTGRSDQRIIKKYCEEGILIEEKGLGKSSIFSLNPLN